MSLEKNKSFVKLLNDSGKYQFTISILFFIVGVICDFYLIYLTFMISKNYWTYVNREGVSKTEAISYNVCYEDSNKQNIKFDKDLSNNNFSYIFQTYCKPLKNSLMIVIYLLGMFVGNVLISQLGNLKKEKILKFFLLTLFLGTFLCFINSYYALLCMFFIQGLSHMAIYLTKCSIISCITIIPSNKFIVLQYFSGISAGSICAFVYISQLDYKIIYMIVSLILLLVLIHIEIVLINNPLMSLYDDNLNDAIEDATKIAVFNDSIREISGECSFELLFKAPQKDDPTYTREYLKRWILNEYTEKDDEEGNTIEQPWFIKEVEEESENLSLSHVESGDEGRNEVFLCILSISCLILINMNIFEVYHYGNMIHFQYFYLMSMVIAMILYILWIVLFLNKIELKYCLIIPLILTITCRLFDSIDTSQEKYSYFLQRAISNSIQLPLNLFLSKNYVFPNRIFYYNTIGYIVYFIISLVPMIIHFLSFSMLNIIYICFGTIGIACFIFISNPILVSDGKNDKNIKEEEKDEKNMEELKKKNEIRNLDSQIDEVKF